MIASVEGIISGKDQQSASVLVGGVGLRLWSVPRLLKGLPGVGEFAKFYTHLHVREDILELYGFPDEAELRLFELLISISGVGPKSALSILEVAELAKLTAAIQEGRADLLTQASGIGRKTAERIILELRGKVVAPHSEATVQKMEGDADVVEALHSLGYKREEAKAAVGKVPDSVKGLQERLKAALKLLSSERRK